MFPKNKSPKMPECYAGRMQKALDRYYANPVKCKNCLSVIQVPKGVKPSLMKRQKFCSHSCSAKYNNLGVTRHHNGNTCRVCEKLIPFNLKFCSKDCRGIISSQRKLERAKKTASRVVSWRRRTKLRAIAHKGGSCQVCGYHRLVRALQFHHLITGEKDFNISRASKCWESVKKNLRSAFFYVPTVTLKFTKE
jgi:predicted nucleic acid-binding Zn ribbon protein